jgi:multiple sugar transport system permease protein
MLPLMAPVLATLAVLAFLAQWNDFLWPLVVLQSASKKTLTIGLATLLTQQGNAGRQMAGATIAFLPTLIFFLSLQRYIVKGLTLGGVKG